MCSQFATRGGRRTYVSRRWLIHLSSSSAESMGGSKCSSLGSPAKPLGGPNSIVG